MTDLSVSTTTTTTVTSEPVAAPAPTTTAAAPATSKATKKPLVDPHLAALMRQSMNDAAVVMAQHAQYAVALDPDFKTSVIKYLHAMKPKEALVDAKAASKKKDKEAVACIFIQRFMGGWSNVVRLSADAKEAELYPGSIENAKDLATENDSVTYIIDYYPIECKIIRLRYASILTLWRGTGGDPVIRPGETLDQCIDRQNENSRLIERRALFDVAFLTNWADEAQEYVRAMLKESMEKRLEIASAYAGSLFWSDAREACMRLSLHKKIIDDDTKYLHDSLDVTKADADKAKLAPLKCFRVVTGSADGDPRCEHLSKADLQALIGAAEAQQSVDLDKYKAALAAMEKPRKPFQTMFIVNRGLYGTCATFSVSQAIEVDLRQLTQGLEEEREARKKTAEAIQQEAREFKTKK